MPWVKAFIRWAKPYMKTAGIALAVFVVVSLVIWLIIEVLIGAAETATYGYVLRLLSTEGGVNAWLARAVTVLFVVGVSYGLRLAVSIKSKQRRTLGWVILAGTFVAFNLTMYACTRSITAVEEGQHFVTATGEAKSWYYVTDGGDWELLPHSGFHPRTGEALNPMTPEAAKQYDAWKRKKAEESDKQTKAEAERRSAQDQAEAERRFRDTYVNERILASGGNVLLAVKADGPGSPADSLQGQIAILLSKNNKNPVSGAFKPAFCAAEVFDGLFDGDQSVVERLRLFDGPPRWLLLVKANFSQADKTDFEGLVSVQGKLAIVRLNKDGRSGPWAFNASGAGHNATTAAEACAKRLVEQIDLDAVLPD